MKNLLTETGAGIIFALEYPTHMQTFFSVLVPELARLLLSGGRS